MNESDPSDAEIEPVFVELDWYDGPRGGVAAVAGKPHYFRAVHDYNHGDDEDDTYLVWPAGSEALAWELEQWAIFVAWNELAQSGRVGPGRTRTPDSAVSTPATTNSMASSPLTGPCPTVLSAFGLSGGGDDGPRASVIW